MSQHTPGPWTADIDAHRAPSADWYAAAIGVGNPHQGTWRTLARVAQPEHAYDEGEAAQAEANARLIAAAPELLAAAELGLWLMERVAGWDKDREPITKFAAQTHGRQFAEAIAKAKGGAL